ncbi:MAG: hypothetical protein HOL07_08135 [Rhodospirillaceae bacterium]|nr:hypothetical protein [Rhodospirillaceae bacterium]MBT4772942.1 hypothetical protein [Rhodospirillaceae bacterium]MBT5358308.1 hypothetical protein [Rhodospirillaceae bacterium]MBT5767919.1 hypothetical protein [Rhodospirillaceae bacterium]MBT6310240.1 hypothetical protein [Rhodospirillaceae bacterium]
MVDGRLVAFGSLIVGFEMFGRFVILGRYGILGRFGNDRRFVLVRRPGILMRFEMLRFVAVGLAVRGRDCQGFGFVLIETRPLEVRYRTVGPHHVVTGLICRAIAQLFELPFNRLDGSVYRRQFYRQPVGLGIDDRPELFERAHDLFFGG